MIQKKRGMAIVEKYVKSVGCGAVITRKKAEVSTAERLSFVFGCEPIYVYCNILELFIY